MLYEQGRPVTTYTLEVKQSELAKQLNISRQALNVHLRKLRNEGCIRTGRGFIDVTEKGLNMLGISANPAFIFVKVSPLKRVGVYQTIVTLPIQRVFSSQKPSFSGWDSRHKVLRYYPNSQISSEEIFH